MAESEAFKGVFDQKHLRKDVVHAENIYWRSDYPLETWKNHLFLMALNMFMDWHDRTLRAINHSSTSE
jgi:hypothetical protein